MPSALGLAACAVLLLATACSALASTCTRPARPIVVAVAGLPRSGSTYLYNLARTILSESPAHGAGTLAGYMYDGFMPRDVDVYKTSLEVSVVVKTHELAWNTSVTSAENRQQIAAQCGEACAAAGSWMAYTDSAGAPLVDVVLTSHREPASMACSLGRMFHPEILAGATAFAATGDEAGRATVVAACRDDMARQRTTADAAGAKLRIDVDHTALFADPEATARVLAAVLLTPDCVDERDVARYVRVMASLRPPRAVPSTSLRTQGHRWRYFEQHPLTLLHPNHTAAATDSAVCEDIGAAMATDAELCGPWLAGGGTLAANALTADSIRTVAAVPAPTPVPSPPPFPAPVPVPTLGPTPAPSPRSPPLTETPSDAQLEVFCSYLAARHDVKPGLSFGTLDERRRYEWQLWACDEHLVVDTPAPTPAPGRACGAIAYVVAQRCEYVARRDGVVPFMTWGRISAPDQAQWEADTCNCAVMSEPALRAAGYDLDDFRLLRKGEPMPPKKVKKKVGAAEAGGGGGGDGGTHLSKDKSGEGGAGEWSTGGALGLAAALIGVVAVVVGIAVRARRDAEHSYTAVAAAGEDPE